MADKLYILPYLRKGLSGFISSQSSEKGKTRAEIDLRVKLMGKEHESGQEKEVDLDRKVQLAGPSDVKHVNESAISLVYPPSSKNQTYNASYMPFMEFYEEDFPWRYTPLKESADGSLCPWIMLVAVTKDEFSVRNDPKGVKVVTFNLSSERYNQVFPAYSQKTKTNQACKMAHVQVAMDENAAVTNETVNALLAENPEKGVSRLLCPSVMPADEAITVFLLPVFESGRLGGLGLPADNVRIDEYASANHAVEFPVYYQWSFRTSKSSGTFSELADKLEMTPDEEYGKLSSNLTVDIADSGLLVKNGRRRDENGEIVIDVPAALRLKGEVAEAVTVAKPAIIDRLGEFCEKGDAFLESYAKDKYTTMGFSVCIDLEHRVPDLPKAIKDKVNEYYSYIGWHKTKDVPVRGKEATMAEKIDRIAGVVRASKDHLSQVVAAYEKAKAEKENGDVQENLRDEGKNYVDALREELLKSPMLDSGSGKDDEDPWVVPPVYGAHHLQATADDLKGNGENKIVEEVNLQLRNRIPAGMGSAVVKEHQESFVNRAWQKVERINELNQIIREYCQMAEVNQAAAQRKVKSDPIFDKELSVMGTDAILRVLNNAKRFRGDVTVEGIKGRIEEAAKGKTPRKKSQQQIQFEKNLSSFQKVGRRPDGILYRSVKSHIRDLLTKQVYADLLATIANSSPETVASDRMLAYARELIEAAKTLNSCVKSNGNYVRNLLEKSGGTVTKDAKYKEMSRLYAIFRKTSVLFHNAQKRKDNEPEIKSYSDIMVSKRKRCIGITKGELDELVDPKTWEDALQSETRIQKLAQQRADEFMATNKWLSGVVEPVYSSKNKKFLFTRPSGQFVPTKNMYFINESCSRLVMAAFGKVDMPSDRKSYGWFAQAAKEAAKASNDIFSAIYTSSNPFYPLQVQVGKSVGYVMDEGLFGAVAGGLKLKSTDKPLAIAFNLKGEDGSVSEKQETVYIIPSSYPGLTYKKEYRFTLDEKLFSGDISYGYQNGVCTDVRGSLISGVKDVNNHILSKYLSKLVVMFGVYPSWKEFLGDVRTINHIWLRKPTSATVSLTDDKCVKLSAGDLIALNDANGALYGKLIAKLNGVEIPWKSVKAQTDLISVKEEAALEMEAAERIETIIEKYKDVERGQLDDWQKFVKSPRASSKFPVMAYPEYLEPTFFYLRELSDEFIMPSSGEMRSNSIAILNSNPKFEEAFLLGMNTEMGQELMWREYPTDQRGSYFRKFWDQTTLPDAANLEAEYYDVKKVNAWEGRLGDNHKAGKGGMIVFAIKGDLMRAYPKTRVYLSAIAGNGSVELRHTADMSSWLTEDTFLVGFQGVTERTLAEEKLCLTFQEEMGSVQFTRTGLDIDGCKNSTVFASKALNKPSIFVLPL